MKVAVYPGSFDPITNGHINLIERGLLIFDKLIIAVATNIKKKPLFETEERIEMIKKAVPSPRIEVDTFEGLLVDYARQKMRALFSGVSEPSRTSSLSSSWPT